MQKVALILFGLLAKNLSLEPKKLTDHFKNENQGMRMNYHPPCPQADKVLGISPHSDANGLTLLLQVNEVQGVQIRRNGIWVPVEPIPGALTVNIGDIIEIMSNGIYKSIEHRAVVNQEERLSIAALHSLRLPDAVIGPIPNLVKENDPNYITVSHEEFSRRVMAKKLDGKSILDYMKIKK